MVVGAEERVVEVDVKNYVSTSTKTTRSSSLTHNHHFLGGPLVSHSLAPPIIKKEHELEREKHESSDFFVTLG